MIRLTRSELNKRLVASIIPEKIPHYLACIYCGKVTELWAYGTGIVQVCWNCGRSDFEPVDIIEDS